MRLRPAASPRAATSGPVNSRAVAPRAVAPAAALVALVLLAGCGADDEAAAPTRSTAPSDAASDPAPSETATPSGGAASPSAERVRAVLDGVELSLEVADDEQERAVGLMRRTSVPPGTGMVFRYDELSNGRYYMFQVPVPLRAVFVRDDRVVSTVLMPPCEETVPAECPTYGADGPYDTVVETAPETLPDVQPGDVLELEG